MSMRELNRSPNDFLPPTGMRLPAKNSKRELDSKLNGVVDFVNLAFI